MSVAKRIGQYEIVELLGRGAMGEVYKAVDSKMFGRQVAVKVLSERLSRNEQALARFKREVEVAAKLEHPNIVTIHDRGEFDDRHYFVMEFIDGTDLAAIIEERQSHKLEELLSIACQTCEAIEFAHSDGVIHRDIKPSNVMITRRGGQAHAKLVDFGIVHVERSNLTRSQTQPGTFSYMSPEQLRNDDVDHRSDLFSLGIVLYEVFTGTHPFDAASEALTTQKILSDEPQPPKQIEAAIPSSLESLILKLLEKDPRQRPQTTAEVTAALDEARRRYMSRGVSDAGDYSNVTDLTRPMVENLVAFGRKKEAEGDLDAALQAFEKAATLAPEVDRLERKIHKLRHSIESEKKLREHLERAHEALNAADFDAAEQHRKEAWILSPESVRVAELEATIREARESGVAAPAVPSEVDSILEAAQGQMDQGDLDGARHKLVDAIRNYPEDVTARLALDRLMQVVGWGGDYVGYRSAIAESRQALDRDDFAAARSACDRAEKAWPDDEEWRPLGAEIDSRRDGMLDGLLEQAQVTIRQAEACGDDESRGLELLAGALETLERARSLGADESRLAAPDKAADGLKADLLARQKRREAEQAVKHRRAEDALARADEALEKARRMETEGPPAAERALDAYESSRKLLAEVEASEPGNPDAAGRLAEIDAAVKRVGRSLKEREERARELDRLLDGARGALERTGDSGRATSAGLGEARRNLSEARTLVERALKLDGGSAAAREWLDRIEESETALERRKRILDTLESGLDRGRAVMARAQKLVVSESTDELRSGERMCRDAVEAFRGVLAVEDGHPEAVEALRNLEVLEEHFSSEIEGRARADGAAQAREERVRTALDEAQAKLAEAESVAGDDEEALRRGVEQCRAAAALLDKVQADDPGNEQGRRQAERGRHLEQELESRLERARREADERRAEVAREEQAEKKKAEKKKKEEKREAEPQPVEAKPEVSKSRRRRELRKAQSHLDEARELIERGDPAEAREILDELEDACREREWLGELLPEVESLKKAVEPAPAPRKRGPLIAAAIAVPIVLIGAIVLVVRGLSPDADPVIPAAPQPPLEQVEVKDPWQPGGEQEAAPADDPAVDDSRERQPDVPEQGESIAGAVADVPPVVDTPPVSPPETGIDDAQPPVADGWEDTSFVTNLTGLVGDADKALAAADASIGREPLPVIIRSLERKRDEVSRFIGRHGSKELDVLPLRLQQMDRKLDSLRYSQEAAILEDRLSEAKTVVQGAIGSVDDAEIAETERLLEEARAFVAANSSRDPAALAGLIRTVEPRLAAHKIPESWMGFYGFACDPTSGRKVDGLTVTARHARGAPVEVSVVTGAGGEFKLILPPYAEEKNSRGRFFIFIANAQGEEKRFDGGGLGFQAYQDGRDRQIDVTGTLCPASN